MRQTLIYGESPYGYLTLVPETELQTQAEKIRKVFEATTFEQARAIDAPGADDPEFDDAEPYDVRSMGFMDDGDWPPNAGMLGLSTLPADVIAVLPHERSMVGQEWVEFEAGDEQRVVAAVTSLGYELRRDDGAIKEFDKLSFGE